MSTSFPSGDKETSSGFKTESIPAGKVRKPRICKLKPAERGFRPQLGSSSTSEFQSYTNFVRIVIPFTGSGIGTNEQGERLYTFAMRLHVKATSDAIGAVIRFGFVNSAWEIVVGLQVIAGSDANELASKAFEKLNPVLSEEADVLSGKIDKLARASWQVLVNERVIDQDQF